MKLIFLFLFILATATTALAQPAGDVKQVALNQEFEIKVGEKVLVENEGLKLGFTMVTEDSRCPEGVTCIWGGNAKIILKLSAPKRRPVNLNLNTGMEPRHKLYGGYDVKLVNIKPPRKKGEKIKPGDYVATIVVTRK